MRFRSSIQVIQTAILWAFLPSRIKWAHPGSPEIENGICRAKTPRLPRSPRINQQSATQPSAVCVAWAARPCFTKRATHMAEPAMLLRALLTFPNKSNSRIFFLAFLATLASWRNQYRSQGKTRVTVSEIPGEPMKHLGEICTSLVARASSPCAVPLRAKAHGQDAHATPATTQEWPQTLTNSTALAGLAAVDCRDGRNGPGTVAGRS